MYIYIKKSPPFPSPLRRSWDGRVMERGGEGSYVEAPAQGTSNSPNGVYTATQHKGLFY